MRQPGESRSRPEGDPMPDHDRLTEQFEASRPRLRAVAYRMLGSHAEAEDAVQETWLRLGRTDATRIDNLGGWLTTVIGRVCLDRLRSRGSRREDALDDHLPRDLRVPEEEEPANQALLADSVGAALLVVLDLLPPAERVAFVLHDVFAVPFEEISTILERSPDAVRQLASRGRRKLQGTAPTADLDLVRQRHVVDAFLRAARGGDFDALVSLLDPDVVMRPDAAAVGMGSLRETRGATAVATVLSGGARGARLAIVEGLAGLVWAPAGTTRGVIEFTLKDDKIIAIDVTGDADRLRELDIVTLDS
jgi:RNA polymerase sigma factor (sigma-70 family)